MTQDDERHKYLRIADDLRKEILSGKRQPGDRLPSIPDLAREHGIARATAASVLDVLTSEGLAVARPGSGTYVRARPERKRLIRQFTLRLNSPDGAGSPLARDMASQGRRAVWTYESRPVTAPPPIRERLRLGEPGDEPDAMCTSYVFEADGEPTELSISWEPLSVTGGTPVMLPEDGPQVGVMDRMRAIGVQIEGCVEAVHARPGTAEECTSLKIPAGSIVFEIERTYYDVDSRPVETADIVLSAERYALVYGEARRG